MFKGAALFITGLKQLLARAELRSVLWRMAGLLLVLMLLLTGGVFWLIDYVANLWIPEGDAWYWQIVSWLAWLLAFVLAVLCGIVSFVALGSAAVAPWLDLLARRVEQRTGSELAEQTSGWMQLVMHSLANSVRPLLGLMLWGGAALLFFWLPPVATALWVYGGVRFLSFELIDTPASRRNWNYARRKSELNEERWFYIGFSGLATLLLMVPLLNLLVIPAAVVGLSQHLVNREE
ncbi:putative sulfate transport protein CysZ [Mariprofundus micogutta]|uniref:Putative sulfate transport protein CysZ n=1 Tax=Mariprofundus micogutta TaxID=1921010 RepID=A0A1L8CN35_9PROT|nr:EI24 domain-containing protein [Mariprofundus micogutta]GAV20332.1 putative sulfate transport protein CysZ [Mariprofundus micogutta]